MKPTNVLFIKSYAYTPNQSFDVPIGILYLSGYLKQHLGDTVSTSLFDMRIRRNTGDELTNAISSVNPDIIGISTLAFEHQFLSDYIKRIRQAAPESIILIGGPYATSNYTKALSENDIDYAVIGEGETVLLNFVNEYTGDKNFQSLNGLAFRNKDGQVTCNPKEVYIDNLDTIPMPDYSLVNFRDYWKNRFQFNGVLAHKKHTSIISSRACPYRCIYCHDIFGKNFRTRSPVHFVQEIEYLYHHHGIREFHIIDDVFNLNRSRMHGILHRIIESGMKIKMAFPNGLRGDILEKEDMLLLKQAGAYMITFAIETGSQRLQTLIKKNIDIPKILDNIRYADQIGLITRGFFMLGFPDETVQEMKLTVKTAASSRLHMASFFIVVPFQNTELYTIAKQMLSNQADADFLSAYIASDSFYEKLTGYNVGRLQKYAYLRFYSPIRLIKLFFKIPDKRYQLSRWLSFAYQLLKY